MKPMSCFDAVSAGLFLDGDVAILSFLTNDAINDREASVVLTREMLQTLNQNIARALKRNDGHLHDGRAKRAA